MTIMRRTIHPVGCAQFITESFNSGRIHVVVDCGMGHGKNPTKRLETLVDSHFAFRNHIDYLFISHFDNDHYNGIQYLIRKKLIDADTYVYVPLLSYSMIYIMDTLEGLFYRKIINSFASVLPQITFVRAIDDNETGLGEYLDIRPEKVNVIDSLTPVRVLFRERPIWEYLPFYIQDKEFLSLFLNECAKPPISIDEVRLRRFHNLSDEDKSKLKKIYKKLTGNHYTDGPSVINMNAMLLISREIPECRQYYGEILSNSYTLVPFRPYRIDRLSRPSCLYTSDVGLLSPKSMNYLLDAVEKYLPEGIGLLQIPHHGSYKCYTSEIYRKLNFEATFINGDMASSNPAICADAINDSYRYATPLYLVDRIHNFVQEIEFINQ